jgi:hypothetical protein
VSFILMDN